MPQLGAGLKGGEGGVAATTHVAKSIFTFSLDQFLNGNEKFCAPYNEDGRGMSSRAGRDRGRGRGRDRGSDRGKVERDKRQLGAGTDSIICICTHARQGTGRNSMRKGNRGAGGEEAR